MKRGERSQGLLNATKGSTADVVGNFLIPHGKRYRGGEVCAICVPTERESLARFDPPGSDQGTPTPRLPGAGRSYIFRLAGPCWTACFPLEISGNFLHNSRRFLHNPEDYSELVTSSADVLNILWTTIR